jgi:iron complex transport system permease protein
VLDAGIVVAGLALCVAVVQAVTRNPLADPYLLGLSAGAALGAVTMIMIGAPLFLTPGAFVGALAALTLTLAFTQAIGGLTPSKAILSGIAVSALAAALTSLVIFWTATGDSYREILSWLLGSLAGAGWLEAAIAAAALVVVAPFVILSGRAMDAFAFGDVAAATLGIDVARTRWLLLGGTALLTGVLVSVSGAIGFVGLVLPHAARLVAGSRHRGLLPLAAIGGAVFMIWTDTAARTLFAPRELPVGIVTAIIGAPAFLLILWRFRRLT